MVSEVCKSFILEGSKIWRPLGFSDWGMVTHAWHETGAFKSVPRHNYWGLKVPKKKVWNGVKQYLKTREETAGGGVIPVFDWFVAFETISEALTYYTDFIRRNYGDAYAVRCNPILYFQKLVDRIKDFEGDSDLQFATDSKYYSKLLNLYAELTRRKDIQTLLDE